MEELTSRELDVLVLLVKGLNNREIGDQLHPRMPSAWLVRRAVLGSCVKSASRVKQPLPSLAVALFSPATDEGQPNLLAS